MMDNDENSVIGIPSACLLPVFRYKFEEITELRVIEVPLRGVYPQDSNFSGSFNIMPEEGIFLFGTINAVLLSFGKYPKLNEDEIFVIAGLEKNNDDTLNIVGRILRFVEANKDAEAV